MKIKKIAILVPKIHFGGGERVGVNLANALANFDDLDISLIVYSKEKIDYEVSDNINIISMDEPLAIKGIYNQAISFFRKVRKLEDVLNNESFDYSISIMSSLNLISLMTTTKNCKKIITEHNVINKSNFLLETITNGLKKILYKKAYKTVAVSQGVKEHLLKNVDKNLDIEVIYNPIDIDLINKKKNEPLEKEYGRYLLGVGRLTEQKGFDMLIEAFSKLKDKSLNLIILGEGEDKNKLIELSKKLCVEEKVLFLGFDNNPYKYMKNSESFVLSSRWEGFGLVVAEALVSDAKVVSFDCKSGPAEILENGKYGILVEPNDIEALVEGISKSLTSKEDLNSKNLSRFSMNFIIGRYYELLY